MRVSFILPIKPYSINKYYYSDRKSKTSAARAWEFEVSKQLAKLKDPLASIRDNFDKEKHGLLLTLDAVYPPSIFWTRDNTLSARMMDLTNWEKPLVDMLFLQKNDGKVGCRTLCLDDKFLVDIRSRKLKGDTESYSVIVTLEIVEANLYNLRNKVGDSQADSQSTETK